MKNIDNSTTILRMQELTSNVWPAKHFFHVNGWIIRISEGITKRANSVLPNTYFGTNIKEDILTVENIYKQFSLLPIFQIADEINPKTLDKELELSDYKKVSKTNVLCLATPKRNIIKNQNNFFVESETKLTEKWLKTNQTMLQETDNEIEGKKAIINRLKIPKPYFFTIKNEKEEAVGTSLGIVQKNYLGIFEVVIDQKHRQKKLGIHLMHNLFKFAEKNKITSIFLQVEEDNIPATKLYNKLGFKKLYSYHYRIKN